MSERHVMGPVVVDRPRRPEGWDAYLFQAFSRCVVCRKTLAVEFMLPGTVMALIPDEKRDEAMRRMSDFVGRRAKYLIESAASGLADPDDPTPPLCKETP